MCIISLTSNNPNFSRIIFKNPSNNVLIKKIRQGNAFGFYTENKYSPIKEHDDKYYEKFNEKFNNLNELDTYLVYFRDGIEQVSYKYDDEDKVDYMNPLKYSSTNCAMNLLVEYFKSLFNYDVIEEDKNYIYSFYVNLIHLTDFEIKIINNFKKYFTDFTIDLCAYETNRFNYYLIVTHNDPKNLVKLCYIILVILSIETFDFFVEGAIVEKIVNILSDIDAPYYIRNIIYNKIINSPNTFNKLKDNINLSKINNFNFTFGNNHFNRIQFANNNIPYNSHIIDFGCGEGAYLNRIIRKADSYICFDIDPSEIIKLKRKIYNKINNSKTSNDIKEKYKKISVFSDENDLYKYINENLIDKINVVIIFSEVIEHIELEQVSEIMTRLYSLFKKNNSIKLITTTPNRDFNCNYFDDKQFRHDDHKFEFTKEEFKTFMGNAEMIFNEFNDNCKINTIFHDIGDSVNNVATTQGAIISVNI